MSHKASETPVTQVFTNDEVVAMMLSFAQHVRRNYGLHSRQLTTSDGKYIVLTPDPLQMLDFWQKDMEQQELLVGQPTVKGDPPTC